MAVQLIRPVGSQRSSNQWTIGVSAVALSMALLGLVSMLHSSGPSILAQTSGALSPIQSADSAESKVASYMAMMATKQLVQKPAQRKNPTLDWNWAPELHRNLQVPDWVGSRWVAPVQGTEGIHLMRRPEHGAHSAQSAVVAASAKAQTAVGKAVSPKMAMPSMHPLRFFPQQGLPTWDTGDVVKSAEKSVKFLHSGAQKQERLLVSSAPQQPGAEIQGTLTQVRSGSLAQQPYKISPEKAGTEKANLEAKVNDLQKALAQVEGQLQAKESQQSH